MKKCTMGTAALAAATLFLVSCSNDDNGEVIIDNGQPQNISIRIAQPETSRAVADPGVDGEVVNFSDGNLILTKSNGEILYIYNFSASGTTDVNSGGNNIVIGDAVVTTSNTTGVTIENISGDVKQAYIIGNTSSFDSSLTTAYNNALVVSKNISGVQALQVNPAMQYDAADGGLSKVTLYGEGVVVNNPVQPAPNTGNLYKLVEIDLYPHVARVEIGNITGGGDIVEYQVNGIYINNFYPTMSLNYKPATIINPGQGNTDIYDAGSTAYTAGMSGILYDDDKNTYFGNTLTNKVKYADAGNTGKVWAYNVLAAPVITGTVPMASHLGSETTKAAQIIVQVQNVTVSGEGDYSGMKYITVKNLYNKSDDSRIDYFKAGYIYTIEKGDFVFEAKNVKEDANLEEIDLQVLVKPITWKVEKMYPELQ